jgi:hypothetical protein
MMNAGLMEDHGLCKVSDFYKIETINSQEYYIGTLVGRLLLVILPATCMTWLGPRHWPQNPNKQ